MQRIPEPELMDDAEQARAYAAGDFAEPHDFFVNLLREHLLQDHETLQGSALDLGCGPGDMLRRIANAFPDLNILGVDGARAMLDLAQDFLRQHGLHERVSLLHRHLPCADLPRAQYDVIYSNSLLHHLQDPLVLWRSIKDYAGQGTRVFVMDLLRPDSEQQARDIVTEYSATEPDILQRDFYHSLLAAYRIQEVEQQLQQTGLQYFSTQIVDDRHWIAWGVTG